MSFNFKQMQDIVIGRIEGQHGDPAMVQLVKDWINLSRDQFVGYGPWHFLMKTDAKALVAAQQEYSTATDVKHINHQEVRLFITKTRLYYLNDDDFLLVVTDPVATGTPAYFRTVGFQKIQLYPIPDAAAVTAHANLLYEYANTLPTALSADSDATGLPEYVDPCILDLAESYAQQWKRSPNEAQMAFGRFIAAVQKLGQENSDILGLSPRDIPPDLTALSQVNRSQ